MSPSALPRSAAGKRIADHGARGRRDAARAYALDRAARNQHPKAWRQRDQERSQRETRDARKIHGFAAVAIAKIRHERGTAEREQAHRRHDQSDLAVVDAERRAQRRNRGSDHGRIECGHENADEQHRHEPTRCRAVGHQGIYRHEISTFARQRTTVLVQNQNADAAADTDTDTDTDIDADATATAYAHAGATPPAALPPWRPTACLV